MFCLFVWRFGWLLTLFYYYYLIIIIIVKTDLQRTMSSQNVSIKTISEFVISGFDTVVHKLPIGVVLLVVYVLAMLANTANICFVAIDKHLHQPMYIFLCNLFGTFVFICLSYLRIVITVMRMTSKKKMFHMCITHLIVIVCFYAPMFVRIVLTRIGVVLTLGERNGLYC